MTLIECFTDSHIDNIAACLRLRPEKMFMLGNEEEMRKPVARYKRLLRQRDIHTEISLCNVRGKDFADICEILTQLLSKETACVIDLTGGDEPVVLAVGAVLARLDGQARERIRVEKYDHAADAVLDCINDYQKLPYKSIHLTVNELIMVHGGVVHEDSYQPSAEDRLRDLAGLWRIVSEEPKEWNRAITLLNEFESRSDSKTQVYLPLAYLSGSIRNFEEKEMVVRGLLDKLQRYGIVDDHSDAAALAYTYQSPMLRFCTQKAGNVLEVKTLLEGRSVLQSGAPFFQDCQMSVSIDWDGVVHDPAERVAETRNEIDVVCMRGTTPLFISCKNGNIGEEELYKLHTVAQRFGGPYARKMLIATDLDRKSPAANRAFIQRAWDMDIFLVTDAAELSREEWKQLFRQTMQ